jgi:hypothetical protein
MRADFFGGGGRDGSPTSHSAESRHPRARGETDVLCSRPDSLAEGAVNNMGKEKISLHIAEALEKAAALICLQAVLVAMPDDNR